MGEVMALAMTALSHKERTQRELTEWLSERVEDEEEVEAAISQLIETGGLDDARFATQFAADKRELKGWGSQRIRDALRDRGISASEVDLALSEEEPEAELERAVELLGSRGQALEDDRGRERALSFLARRGYGYETAYEAVRRAGKAA